MGVLQRHNSNQEVKSIGIKTKMVSQKIYESSWNDQLVLNIVIPTYNRPENLKILLWKLAECKQPGFGVIVNDNQSDFFLDEKEISDIALTGIPIRIYRNKYHLGPDASVLRAMELADSEWIYILGDSKIPQADAISHILRDVEGYPISWGIVYTFDKVIEEPTLICSLDELFNASVKYGDLFLGGNSILSRRAFKKYFNIASQLTLTRSMLAVFHLMSMHDGQKILFSPSRIVGEFLAKPESYDPKLSLLECWAQFGLLVTLPFRKSDAKKLNRLILGNERFTDHWIFIKFCLIKLFRERLDISKHLKLILSYRYSLKPLAIEKLFVIPLYVLSQILSLLRFTLYERARTK